MADPDFVPPDLPFEPLPTTAEFMLDRDNWTFLNHGAFGASLRCGYDRATQWREYTETQPLRFFDRSLLPHLVHTGRQLATFTNADRAGLALLPNVTAGINAAMNGYMRTNSSGRIVLWDTTYGSVKKIARTVCPHVTEVPFQTKYLDRLDNDRDDAFVDALLETLDTSCETMNEWENALLILDHTTSNTALTMPIERLAQIGKEHGMIVLVDGAHGLLAQPVDFADLPSVDIYISNGHKWLSCPRGVAMMYCPNEELRETILRRPAVFSHGLDDGYFR